MSFVNIPTRTENDLNSAAGETAKLQELEAEAEKLRAELNGIK